MHANSLIKAEISRHQERSTVSFIGGAGSGKTTAAALLVYCMSAYWAARHMDVYPMVTTGGRRLRDALEGIKKGRYPAHARDASKQDTVITINDLRGRPRARGVVIHDMAGMHHAGLLAEGEPGRVLAAVLQEGLGSLVFAKRYVLVADCSRPDAGAGDLGAAVRGIAGARGIAYGTGGGIGAPVAVLLTKTDTLPEDVREGPARRIAARYPGLLEIIGSGREAGFFKSGVAADPGGGIALPLAYDRPEYSRLISWILDG
ncbi:MAG: hypothetical protein MPJ06_08645 [Nitrosopumilus sp.]|nr:hypothetical protein [Nitrosopumilus sp.]MDA7944048.1 hypothetical protein [Nitrosopumilus sp.]MDA7999425.1 hypothetical protein [Nitrosopumilus sp.]